MSIEGISSGFIHGQKQVAGVGNKCESNIVYVPTIPKFQRFVGGAWILFYVLYMYGMISRTYISNEIS